MNVLFVCKWNRFRSKLAEAIFKKLNKNKAFKVKSAGIFPGAPITKEIIITANKLGVKVSKNRKPLNYKTWIWADYIIIVADNVPRVIFNDFEKNYHKKIIHWKFKDVYGDNIKDREKLALKIKKNIELFLKSHNN